MSKIVYRDAELYNEKRLEYQEEMRSINVLQLVKEQMQKEDRKRIASLSNIEGTTYFCA